MDFRLYQSNDCAWDCAVAAHHQELRDKQNAFKSRDMHAHHGLQEVRCCPTYMCVQAGSATKYI